MKRVNAFRMVSDDGFAVEFKMPDRVLYEEGEDQLRIGMENMLDTWAIYYPTGTRWRSGLQVSDSEAKRIMANVEAAMAYMCDNYQVIQDK